MLAFKNHLQNNFIAPIFYYCAIKKLCNFWDAIEEISLLRDTALFAFSKNNSSHTLNLHLKYVHNSAINTEKSSFNQTSEREDRTEKTRKNCAKMSLQYNNL